MLQVNPLRHRLFFDHDIVFNFLDNIDKLTKKLSSFECSIFHTIFKYLIFQRRQKALLWSKGLTEYKMGRSAVHQNIQYDKV